MDGKNPKRVSTRSRLLRNGGRNESLRLFQSSLKTSTKAMMLVVGIVMKKNGVIFRVYTSRPTMTKFGWKLFEANFVKRLSSSEKN